MLLHRSLRSDVVWRLAVARFRSPRFTFWRTVISPDHLPLPAQSPSSPLKVSVGTDCEHAVWLSRALKRALVSATTAGIFLERREGPALLGHYTSRARGSVIMEGRSLKESDKRVVSLLPAASEMLAFLGGEHLLVGRGHEDDFPPSITDRPIVTAAKHAFTTSAEVDQNVTNSLALGEGLYSLDEEALISLRPHVILTQALCSVCAIDYGLVHRIARRLNPPPEVLSLTPGSLEDIIDDVAKIGEAVGMEKEGKEAAESLRRRVAAASSHVKHNASPPRIVFMEWTDPIFCGGHWTPQLIEMAGGVHPLNPTKGPGMGACESFRITPEELAAVDPDWIIVCPCGLDINTSLRELADVTHREWWTRLRAVKENRVVVVDGNQMFNRSGPRIIDAFEWLVGLLNDNWLLMPANFPWKLWSPDLAPDEEEEDDEEEQKEVKTRAVQNGRGGGGDDAAKGSQNGQCNSDWNEPHLPVDIEEIHRVACCAGEKTYRDPHTGFIVFTEAGLRRRGTCCGNCCRHCPFGHFNVEPWKGPRKNTIKEPTLIATEAVRRIVAKSQANGAPLDAVYFTGQPSDLESLSKAKQEVILVTAFDVRSGRAVAPPRGDSPGGEEEGELVSVRVIMDQTRNLRKALLLVPVSLGVDEETLKAEVQRQLTAQVPWKVRHISWTSSNGAEQTATQPLTQCGSV